MDTSLKKSSAVLSVSSRLHTLLSMLETAVKDLKEAKAKTPDRQPDSYAVHTALEKLATAIENDEEMKARPALRDLVGPDTDPKKIFPIRSFFTAATTEDMRSKYYKDVIDRLTREVNAPENLGGRRRKTRSRKTKRSKTQKRRR